MARPEGQYDWYSIELCRCGYFHASNRGKCIWCFAYYGDVKLSEYLDWMINQGDPAECFASEARRVLECYGAMLLP